MSRPTYGDDCPVAVRMLLIRAACWSVLLLLMIFFAVPHAWGAYASAPVVSDNGNGTHTITAQGGFDYCQVAGSDCGTLFLRFKPPPPYPQSWFLAGSNNGCGTADLAVTRNNYHGTTIYQAYVRSCFLYYYGPQVSFAVDLTPKSCLVEEPDPTGAVSKQFDVVGSAVFARQAGANQGYLKAYIEKEDGTYATLQKLCPDVNCTFRYSDLAGRLCSRTPRCEPYSVYFVAWPLNYTNLQVQSPIVQFTVMPDETPEPDPDGGPTTDGQEGPEGTCETGELGSFADERTRILHEDMPIPGTDIGLHYASNRVSGTGHHHVFTVPVSGEDPPCCQLISEVEVSGKSMGEILPVLPHQTSEVTWDGLDGSGAPVHGPVTATVRVGYDYSLSQSAVEWKQTEVPLYIPRPVGGLPKGWTISIHHHLDPADPLTLYKGDGTRVTNPGPIDPAILAWLGGAYAFAEDNGLLHVFSSTGRHERTVDLAAGATLSTLGYDGEGRLVSITDRFGAATVLQRDPAGVLTGILSPDGIQTALTVDANGHLSQVTLADNSAYAYEYSPTGLLTLKTDPAGNEFDHVYDSDGKLTDVTDEEGGHWQFARAAGEEGTVVYQTVTGEGNTTSYVDHVDDLGQYTSVISSPTGAQTLYSRSSDGLAVNKTLPCGMDLTFEYAADPEYGYKSVTEMHESTPAPLERVTLRQRSYEDTNQDDVPDLITETVTVNGKATTSVDNTLQGQEVTTSPEGRTVSANLRPGDTVDLQPADPGPLRYRLRVRCPWKTDLGYGEYPAEHIRLQYPGLPRSP